MSKKKVQRWHARIPKREFFHDGLKGWIVEPMIEPPCKMRIVLVKACPVDVGELAHEGEARDVGERGVTAQKVGVWGKCREAGVGFGAFFVGIAVKAGVIFCSVESGFIRSVDAFDECVAGLGHVQLRLRIALSQGPAEDVEAFVYDALAGDEDGDSAFW